VSLVDVFLVLAVVGAVWSGYRQGLVVALFGFTGFLLGAVLAIVYVPRLVHSLSSPLVQAALIVVGVLVCAASGQAVLGLAGAWLRDRFT